MTDHLPAAPARLPPLQPGDVIELDVGRLVARIHDRGGRHPTKAGDLRHFGPLAGRGRFDHHPPGFPKDHRDHGVAYLAVADAADPGDDTLDLLCAEQIQAGDTLTVVDTMTLSIVELTTPVTLLDASGGWGQRTRCGAHLSTAPHEEVQAWARAIHRDYPAVEGVRYRPSTGGHGWALAVNERAAAQLRTARLVFQRRLRDMEGPLSAAASRLHVKIAYL